MRLGVVIPLANEEKAVEGVVARVLTHLTGADGVFCVLDNCSRDRTRELVENMSRADPRVVCVWAPENRCVVDAYFRGYRAALAAGARWILEMDGGLSHLPEEIPQFIHAMTQGYDYVGGCRFMAGGSHTGSLQRYLVSRVGTMLANLVLGTRMRDMTSGFECFSAPALEAVLLRGVRSKAHFFQTEIKFHLRDWRWTEVPINYHNSCQKVGANSLWDASRNLWRLFRTSRKAKRRMKAA